MSVLTVDHLPPSPGPVRTLTGLEARRAVRSPWLWLGLALTVYLIRDVRHLGGRKARTR